MMQKHTMRYMKLMITDMSLYLEPLNILLNTTKKRPILTKGVSVGNTSHFL